MTAHHMLRCLLILFGLGVAPCAAHALNLYALSARTNTLHHITLDPETDQPRSRTIGPLRPLPQRADLSELVILADGHAYTVDRRHNRLLKLRLQDAIIIANVEFDNQYFVSRRGIDMAPDGLLYGVLPGMQLRTMNPISGKTMLVAPITGPDVIEAIAFSPTGSLYAVGNTGSRHSRRLYTIDTQTGRAAHIADLPVPDLDTLTWSDGFLYAADSHGRASDLYRINPETGELTNMGSTGVVELNGIGAVQPQQP